MPADKFHSDNSLFTGYAFMSTQFWILWLLIESLYAYGDFSHGHAGWTLSEGIAIGICISQVLDAFGRWLRK